MSLAQDATCCECGVYVTMHMLILALDGLTGNAIFRGREHLHWYKGYEVPQSNAERSRTSRSGVAA
jgi:hypothetical protein